MTAIIVQLEQLGFRAWPAAQITQLGSWAVQLTPYYPSKRGNSVNFLDPTDNADIEKRVDACEALFNGEDKQTVFRLTPLAPAELKEQLLSRGYTPVDGSSVMLCDLRSLKALQAVKPRLPLRLVHFREDQEIGYARISGGLHNRSPSQADGLAQVLSSIKPDKKLTAAFSGADLAACMLCVSENGYTGLFDLCINQNMRRHGYAKALVLHAMEDALSRGDHSFWLQVETANEAAQALYQALSFSTVYEYIYYCK
ncbi:GNAT family N-acetyltransferase [Brucellaceae bacterium C25G]